MHNLDKVNAIYCTKCKGLKNADMVKLDDRTMGVPKEVSAWIRCVACDSILGLRA